MRSLTGHVCSALALAIVAVSAPSAPARAAADDVAVAAPAGCLSPRPIQAPAKPGGPIDELLVAYELRGERAIRDALSNQAKFDKLRPQIESTVELWKTARRPVQAVFLLEFARVSLEHGWRLWLDVLDVARRFVMSRPEAPGVNPKADAFEIAWHKAAVALLEGLRRPDLLTECGRAPLDNRMTSALLPADPPMLIDPWIDLTRGIAEEAFTFIDAQALRSRGPNALMFFDAAAQHASTRGEATVRRAWILIKLVRFADALSSLEALGDPPGDVSVRYWARLFRGRALEGLGRFEEATLAYETALTLAPGAQSARVGLMTVELRRERPDEAFRRADDLRRKASDMFDPWWTYSFADRRFFDSRLEQLRTMSRR